MTARRTSVRHLAHRAGILCSPSLVFAGIPFSNARHRARLAAVRAEGDHIRAEAYRRAAADIEARQDTDDDDARHEYGQVDRDTEVAGEAVRRMAAHLRVIAEQIHPSTREPQQ